MDIRKIEAFAKVFELCSFSKAGKALYLSQPTISAHVATLEHELSVQLFDRIGRTVVPTKAGEILYVHAKRIFEASELALSEIRKLQDRITGRLELGGSTIPANYVLPQILAQFWKLYPEVIMDLSVGDSEEIVSQVRDNSLMLGVVGGIFQGADLEYVHLANDSLRLVMRPDIYARYEHLQTDEFLKALPWVMREEGSGTRAAMNVSMSKLGIDIHGLRSVIVVRNAVAMTRCLVAGMGAAITSALTVSAELDSGCLISVELPDLQMERSFYVVFNKRRSLFPAAVKLIEFLQSHVADISSRSA